MADDEHRWAVSQKTGRASALESAVASLALTRQAYAAGNAGASPQSPPAAPESSGAACPQSDSGLTLPAGFCATIFADGIGHARHLVVAPDGVVYVNTWSGRYYGNDTPHAGGFLVALKDNTGAGKAVIPMPAPRAFPSQPARPRRWLRWAIASTTVKSAPRLAWVATAGTRRARHWVPISPPLSGSGAMAAMR